MSDVTAHRLLHPPASQELKKNKLSVESGAAKALSTNPLASSGPIGISTVPVQIKMIATSI